MLMYTVGALTIKFNKPARVQSLFTTLRKFNKINIATLQMKVSFVSQHTYHYIMQAL